MGLHGRLGLSVGGSVRGGHEQTSSPGRITPVLVHDGKHELCLTVAGFASFAGITLLEQAELGWNWGIGNSEDITPSCTHASLLMYISDTALLTYMSWRQDISSPTLDVHVTSTSNPPSNDIGSCEALLILDWSGMSELTSIPKRLMKLAGQSVI